MSAIKISFQELPNKFKRSEKVDVPDLPPRLLMDLKSECNLKCPMCIVHGDPTDPKIKDIIGRSMNLEHAKTILNEVMSVKPAIGPSLWSEPLMNKQIIPQLTDMKERELNVSINTNGLLLNKKMAIALTDIQVDSISISIDSTTAETLQIIRGVNQLDKIKNHVKQLLTIRGERSLPRVGVSFTKQKENLHELDDFISEWIEIVDFVRVGEVFEDGSFKDIEIDENKRKPCPELYSTMAIHTDGEVSICCLDGFKEETVGNVISDGVKEIWNGDKFQKIRTLHETGRWDQIPLCKNCERWASSDYEEYVKNNVFIRKSPEYTFYNNMKKMANWNKNCRHEDTPS